MNIDSNVLAYWQHCANLHALMQIIPRDIQDAWRVITMEECVAGKIADQPTIESLLLRGNTVVIAPRVAVFATDNDPVYFIPYYLLAEITITGKFVPKTMHALPVIPKTVVESATLQPIVLAGAEQFENYLAIHPPVWQDDPEQLNWQAQLAYADQLLTDVTNSEWIEDLQQLGFTMFPNVVVLPLADLAPQLALDVSILDNPQAVELIAAERKSGKSAYARSLITDAWVEAAVKKAPPPEYVWLQQDCVPRYARITDEKYLAGDQDIITIHAQLQHKFNLYYKGKQLLKNWQEVTQRLQNLYSEYGGIMPRQKQLSATHQEAKAQTRLLQVLYTIWERQIELVPIWNMPLDFIPVIKRQRLQRLYKFFQHNFPDIAVRNLNQVEMTEILQTQIKRAENSERCIADVLHQVENDLQQETLLRGKLEQWERQHNYDISSNKLWDEIVELAKQYWLFYFNESTEYAEFFSKQPSKIDMLIVEHAEYVTPMAAAALLAVTKQAVIMGNYDTLINPTFSTQIDYAVAQEYGIVACDSDFEDLQFDGVLGSVGNLWNLAASGREADRTFTKRETIGLDYTIIDTPGLSQRYLGSRVNFAEIDAIVYWLQQNHKTSMKIAIYTTFSGQRQCLIDTLHAAAITNVTVSLLQEPSFGLVDLVLFSPVYTSADSGPYNFDRGSAMLENMIANTGRKLILVGDSRIFKPQLHSAAGKFARLFLKEEVVGV